MGRERGAADSPAISATNLREVLTFIARASRDDLQVINRQIKTRYQTIRSQATSRAHTQYTVGSRAGFTHSKSGVWMQGEITEIRRTRCDLRLDSGGVWDIPMSMLEPAREES